MGDQILTQFQQIAKQASDDVKRAVEALNAFQQSDHKDHAAYEKVLQESVKLALSTQRILHAAIQNPPHALGPNEVKMLNDFEIATEECRKARQEKLKSFGNASQTEEGKKFDDFGNEVNA